MFAPVAVDAINRDRVGDMQLPGAKGAFLHIVAIDRMKDNAIERYMLVVPVGRTLFYAYAIV